MGGDVSSIVEYDHEGLAAHTGFGHREIEKLKYNIDDKN